ncbi:MAG: hypothetical protein J6A30_00505 [Ruminococcus sp.]|nr:hypothetical protein [Ruminococcus sp.]
MMKKGSFAGLLYREFYLAKNACISYLIMFDVFALLGWLALLSMKFGNFEMLFDNYSDSDSDSMKKLICTGVIISMKYIPSALGAMISFICAEATCRDTLTSWNCFIHCTPVTPIKYSSIKTVSTAIYVTIAFILSFSYLFSIKIALGEDFTSADIAVIICLLSIFTVLGIISQIFVTLVGDVDKGMVLSVITIAVPLTIISITGKKNNTEESSANEKLNINTAIDVISDKALEFLPLVMFVLIGAFVLLFISMILIYKRREK